MIENEKQIPFIGADSTEWLRPPFRLPGRLQTANLVLSGQVESLPPRHGDFFVLGGVVSGTG